jgi:tRNA nucleotidyltransferase (CCA-adding enzyme)
MTDEARLIEKLQLIEALFAGAATPGEREAAALARDRIRNRLREHQQTDPAVEFAFKLRDRWSHKLLTALLRRYQIRPYRYRGQRYTTIMARVPQQFVNEVLWPEFQELNRTLATFLEEVTDRVIAQGIDSDTTEVEVASEPIPLGSGANLGFEEA